MTRKFGALAACSLAALAVATPAAAQFNRAPPPTDVPRCARALGTVSIAPPDNEWWTRYGLSSPEQLIKLMVQRSGCLRVVDRGKGLAMRGIERGLGGELQRGSNVGAGQVRAADFTIVPDIADATNDQGGLGAGLGGLIGGRFGAVGAIAGGIRTQQSTARVLLSLVNVRTTEQEYVAEGTTSKTNVSLGLGGFGGALGGVGGGYSNTPIGQVIAQAYLNAFVDLVAYMERQQPGQAQAAAPIQSYAVTGPGALRATPSPTGRLVRSFQPGATVYPTGQKNGVWWEVDDETGNRGWITSTRIAPR